MCYVARDLYRILRMAVLLQAHPPQIPGAVWCGVVSFMVIGIVQEWLVCVLTCSKICTTHSLKRLSVVIRLNDGFAGCAFSKGSDAGSWTGACSEHMSAWTGVDQ